MTGVVYTQLTGLAHPLADMKVRVRAAVAGGLGRAVGDAVRQVVQAVVAGPSDPPRPAYAYPSPARWDEDERVDHWNAPGDPWAEDTDEYESDLAAPARADAVGAGLATSVAAGVYAARWWLGRRGTLLAAAGIGLGVGLLGVLGGPIARAAVAAVAAVADILGATDALGAAAARLDHS